MILRKITNILLPFLVFGKLRVKKIGDEREAIKND